MSEENQNKKSVEINEEDVAQFLGSSFKKNTEEQESQEADLPRDPITNPDTESSNNFKISFLEKEDVDVTDEEKALFLKTLLNDTEFEIPVSLMNGQMQVSIKAKSSHAQNLILQIVDQRSFEEEISNLMIVHSWLQEYSMALMITEVNGKKRPHAEITNQDDVDTAREKLDPIVQEYYRDLGVQWDILLRALHLFETKKVKMQDECLNENFWKGVDLG